MNIDTQIAGRTWAEDHHDALAQAVARSVDQRIMKVEIDGRTLWIKRYDVEAVPLPRRLHSRLSRFMPYAFMRSPHIEDSEGQRARELRKMQAFESAGLHVPDMVWTQENVVVLGDATPIQQVRLDALKRTDPQAHDRILIECAEALAKVHANGLCHGRPHPRDFFSVRSEVGFLDFEEEPEAVMALATAQARDLWLMFFQISSQARLPETSAQAFAAYRVIAPEDVIRELNKIVDFFRFTIRPLRFLKRFYLGGDGKRLLKAMEFFDKALKN
ncbi:serine/threonine protein phosphatase [Paenochrobactrum sp. BZR 588]|uniref:serine/threonine protein phosphatase n=1 Tax=unclassified Paenochrobactrum TaxID=2639760 RepID=UPI003852B010